MITLAPISLFDLLAVVSSALDLVSPAVTGHHRRVGYIATRLAQALGLDREECSTLLAAGLLHDAGAFTLKNRLDALHFETEDTGHSEKGYRLLRKSPRLAEAAILVRHHHALWRKRDPRLPLVTAFQANLLCLADRVDTLITMSDGTPDSKVITRKIKAHSGNLFAPGAVAVFEGLSRDQDFWNVALSPDLGSAMSDLPAVHNPVLSMDELLEFAELIAQIIDFRSRFTATHSKGVAATARYLAQSLGFDAQMQKFIYLAGLLHDLGKLAVPSEIIEKPGPLSETEMNVMRRHTEVSDKLLRAIPGFEELAEVVSCHHERLDGSGYPFRYTGDRLNLPCRIMAVADVFTAITEDRPYRAGMERERSIAVMEELAAGKLVDPDVVFIVKNEYEAVNKARINGQETAHKEFRSFYTP